VNNSINFRNRLYILAIFVIGFSLIGLGYSQTLSNPASEMLKLVNEARASTQICGTEALPPVGPVTLNEQLNQAALVHSNDMATNNFLSHTGSDKSSFDKRIESQGYIFGFAGENVAAGKSTAQDTITQWLNSEGHCRNIMSGNFTQMGIGVSENSASIYKVYWAQVFATPFGSPAENTSVTTSSPVMRPNSNVIQNTTSTSSTPDTTSLENSPGPTNTDLPQPTGMSETTTEVSIIRPVPNQQANTSSVGPEFATELLNLINQARMQTQSCGGQAFPAVPALTLNDSLMRSAQGHSTSMAENNFFGQTGLDGKNFDKRAEAQGYRFSSIAENIIAGRPTVGDVMGSLLETEGYCRGLMSSEHTEIGIGYDENPSSQYKYYWTLTFANPL